MKRVTMTARQREDTILELLRLRDSLLGVMRHSSQAKIYCPHLLTAGSHSFEWAYEGINQVDSLIEQVRALPVREDQILLTEPKGGAS